MKRLFLLFAISLFFASCFNTNEEGTKEQEEYTQGNTKKEATKELEEEQYIQDNFCGVKFGANKAEVITQFERNGFYLDEQGSSKTQLVFDYKQKYFLFEEGYWNFLSIGFNFNQFWGITFVYNTTYKEEAINNFNNVVSSLSSKYKMDRPILESDNVLGEYYVLTKEGKGISIKCLKKEDYGGYYTIHLFYFDKKFNHLIE